MATSEDRRPAAGGAKDTTDYSASKAPATRSEAEERESTADTRLIPGGARGAKVDVGMSAMHRDEVPSEARRLDLVNYGDSPKGKE